MQLLKPPAVYAYTVLYVLLLKMYNTPDKAISLCAHINQPPHPTSHWAVDWE